MEYAWLFPFSVRTTASYQCEEIRSKGLAERSICGRRDLLALVGWMAAGSVLSLPNDSGSAWVAEAMALALPAETMTVPALTEEWIEKRFKDDLLVKPRPQVMPEEPIMPDWLNGIWDVRSELTALKRPLGNKVLPETLQDGKSGIDGTVGKSLKYRARFALRRDGKGVGTDRAFNTKETVNAYAGGREMIARVDWNPRDTRLIAFFTGGANARSIQILNGARTSSPMDPSSQASFTVSELFRQIYENPTDEDSPKMTDFESTTTYRKQSDTKVVGMQRIATYLPVRDEHYAEAADQAVLLQDYRLILVKNEKDSDKMNPRR